MDAEVAGGPRQCFYEVLAVERDAGDDVIRSAYRKLALKWHPDKNQDRVEEATAMFRVVQNAYEVLSDPRERAFYDKNREAILRGGHGNARGGPSQSDEGPDLFPFFTASCFSGFGDDEQSFFAVYARVFHQVDEIERNEGEKWSGDEPAATSQEQAPSFGNSASPHEEVKAFYDHFLTFTTARPYYTKDKWNLADAPNREVRRAMEKENKKERLHARRDYSSRVKALAQFVRKRDPRVWEHQERVKAETLKREALEKAAREQRQHEYDEQRRQFNAAHEAEDDDELLEALARAADEMGFGATADTARKGRRGRRNRMKQGASTGGTGEETAGGGVAGGDGEEDGDTGAGLDLDVSILPDEAEQLLAAHGSLHCPACRKDFRSLPQWHNHERSKKHIAKVEELRAQLLQDACSDGQETEHSGAEDGEDEDDGAAEEEEEEESEGSNSDADDDDVEEVEDEDEGEVGSDGAADGGVDEGEAPRKHHDALPLEVEPVVGGHEGIPEIDRAAHGRGARQGRRRALNARRGAKPDVASQAAAVSSEDEKDSRSGGSHRERRARRKVDEELPAPLSSNAALTCAVCRCRFPSRNKLFQHLKTSGHAAPRS